MIIFPPWNESYKFRNERKFNFIGYKFIGEEIERKSNVDYVRIDYKRLCLQLLPIGILAMIIVFYGHISELLTHKKRKDNPENH